MLILDDTFRNLLDTHFNEGVHVAHVKEYAKKFFSNYSSFDINIILNIMRVCSANEDLYDTMFSIAFTAAMDFLKHNSTKYELPKREISKCILAVSILFMVEEVHKDIDKFVRFTRDIATEIARKKFNVVDVTEEMKESVSNSYLPDSYSVESPKPGSWDAYYYKLCQAVATNSKCLSRSIGAVLVKDKSIVSTGYNGPPRGTPRCDERWLIDNDFSEKYMPMISDDSVIEGRCPRYVIGFKSGQGLDVCPAGHAERNALINAARQGIKTKETILYMTCGVPCTPCLVEIINAGVSEIVVTAFDYYDASAEYVLSNSDLKVRLFDFIKV